MGATFAIKKLAHIIYKAPEFLAFQMKKVGVQASGAIKVFSYFVELHWFVAPVIQYECAIVANYCQASFELYKIPTAMWGKIMEAYGVRRAATMQEGRQNSEKESG